MFKLLLLMTSMFFVTQSFAETFNLQELKGQIYNDSSDNLQGATFEIKLICVWYDMSNTHECGKKIVSAPLDSNNSFQLPSIDFNYNSGLHKSHVWIQLYIANSQRNQIWSIYNLVTNQSEEMKFIKSYQQYRQISFVELPGDTVHFTQKNDADWICRTNIEQIVFPYNVKINISAYDAESRSIFLTNEISVLFKNGKDDTAKLSRTLLFIGGDISKSTRFTAQEQVVQGEMSPSTVYSTKNFSENSLSELWSNLNEVSCRP